MFANSVTRQSCICHVKNPRLWHDLPTPVNDKEFSPFHEGSIFAKPFELTYHKKSSCDVDKTRQHIHVQVWF